MGNSQDILQNHITEIAVKGFIFNEVGKLLVLNEIASDDIENNKIMNYDDAGNSTPTNTTFDLPGGHLIFPETPIEALVREISEETQLKVKIISPFDAWS